MSEAYTSGGPQPNSSWKTQVGEEILMEYAYLSNDFFQIQVQVLVIQIIQVQAYQCIANSISYRTRKSNKYLFLEKLDVDKVDYVQC